MVRSFVYICRRCSACKLWWWVISKIDWKLHNGYSSFLDLFFVDSKRYLKCICVLAFQKPFAPLVDTEPETWLLFNAKLSPFRFGVSYYILISVFARPNNHPELRACHVGDALARKFMKGPKLFHLGYGSTLGCQREHQHDHIWYWRIQPFLGSPIPILEPWGAVVLVCLRHIVSQEQYICNRTVYKPIIKMWLIFLTLELRLSWDNYCKQIW